ncbi:DUF4358 domain-containing protein [Ruminococcus difficilis]|uniref:DUF4358 domain-containing protein n=1 Tax=Ruminococcus difficilis TaxID=2763069 RepID=A0A934U060_9FIRM|nr:DUF4358 domain-containing protein [Ruminococcus difficilis]MBK6088090.1 DUF4358 domain-containing protein [Ruminococcus difficilis]
MKRFLCVIAVITVLAVTLCACGRAAKPLSEIFEKLKTDYNITDMLEYKSADDLSRYGIKSEDVEESAGGVNKTGVNQEEIVLVKAKDADAAKRVEDALNKRLESKLNETKNYNPEQYAIVEKCSVDADDNYVSMIISSDAEAMKKDYRAGIGIK